MALRLNHARLLKMKGAWLIHHYARLSAAPWFAYAFVSLELNCLPED